MRNINLARGLSQLCTKAAIPTPPTDLEGLASDWRSLPVGGRSLVTAPLDWSFCCLGPDMRRRVRVAGKKSVEQEGPTPRR
jgi:hypothetical protein